MRLGDIVVFESADEEIRLDVEFDGDTVWLTQHQMASLFEKDRSVISRHVSNIFKDGELDKESNVHYLHIAQSDKPVAFYDLDVAISVGYRVKSKRGVPSGATFSSVHPRSNLTKYLKISSTHCVARAA